MHHGAELIAAGRRADAGIRRWGIGRRGIAQQRRELVRLERGLGIAGFGIAGFGIAGFGIAGFGIARLEVAGFRVVGFGRFGVAFILGRGARGRAVAGIRLRGFWPERDNHAAVRLGKARALADLGGDRQVQSRNPRRRRGEDALEFLKAPASGGSRFSWRRTNQ
jgi:hypothetical protein